MKNIVPVLQIIAGIMSAFLTVLMLRVVTPITTAIFDAWAVGGLMRIGATVAYWLVIFFVLYTVVWVQFFSRKADEVSTGNG